MVRVGQKPERSVCRRTKRSVSVVAHSRLLRIHSLFVIPDPSPCSFFLTPPPPHPPTFCFTRSTVHYANEPQSVGTEASLTPRRLVPPLPPSSHSFLSLPDSFSLFSRLILPSLHCSRSSSRCAEATVLVGFRLTFRASCIFFPSFSSESRGRVNVRFHALDRGYSSIDESIDPGSVSVWFKWLWFFFFSSLKASFIRGDITKINAAKGINEKKNYFGKSIFFFFLDKSNLWESRCSGKYYKWVLNCDTLITWCSYLVVRINFRNDRVFNRCAQPTTNNNEFSNLNSFTRILI